MSIRKLSPNKKAPGWLLFRAYALKSVPVRAKYGSHFESKRKPRRWLPPPPIKKPTLVGFCYWGRLDSNQRSRETGDLQSPAISAMRHPQMGNDAGERT